MTEFDVFKQFYLIFMHKISTSHTHKGYRGHGPKQLLQSGLMFDL